MSPVFYSTAFKTSYLIFVIPTVLVVVTAVLSAKEMGGTLGQGIKKIAAGSIIHTALIMAYLALEYFKPEFENDNLIRLSFIINGVAGAILLILGFAQVYKITKKLKLFTI